MKRWRIVGLIALLGLVAAGAIAQVTTNCSSTNVFSPACYNLGQFAATTSAQLRALITDETGSGGSVVFATSPTITSPTLTTVSSATGNSGSIASATNFTIVNIGSTRGLYLVMSSLSAQVSSQYAAASWVISAGDSTCVAIAIRAGANMIAPTCDGSGNIQVQQTSGGTQAAGIFYSYTLFAN